MKYILKYTLFIPIIFLSACTIHIGELDAEIRVRDATGQVSDIINGYGDLPAGNKETIVIKEEVKSEPQ